MSAVSAWAAPKHEMHSPCLSAACRGALHERQKCCSFIEGSHKRESPDSGRESMDQQLQALRAAEKRRVGRAERGLDPLQWPIQWRRLRVSKSQYLVVIAEV